jgi:hypothetical protein
MTTWPYSFPVTERVVIMMGIIPAIAPAYLAE